MEDGTVTVELPDSLRSFVDERVRRGDYADPCAIWSWSSRNASPWP
jgi:hypothetical protein